MGQVLLFLAAVNSVPWALYFLLREPAAEGEVWALFAWLLPTVWSPTIVITMALRGADGSSLVFWWTLCAVYGGVALAGTVRLRSRTPAIR